MIKIQPVLQEWTPQGSPTERWWTIQEIKQGWPLQRHLREHLQTPPDTPVCGSVSSTGKLGPFPASPNNRSCYSSTAICQEERKGRWEAGRGGGSSIDISTIRPSRASVPVSPGSLAALVRRVSPGSLPLGGASLSASVAFYVC